MAGSMKTTIPIFLTALLLCGCGQKADSRDARIAKLETNYTALASAVRNLKEVVAESLTNTTSFLIAVKNDETKRAGLENELRRALADQEAQTETLKVILSNLAASFQSPRQPPRVTTPPATAYRDGVPLAVYNSIAAQAAREWPNDYSMQVSEIKHQVEAYQKLHKP